VDGLGIPQANSVTCFSTQQAIQAINERATDRGIVIKARGLTGGKGVTVCDSKEQALNEITNHAQAYGPEVLIAERLLGQEFSVFGISDGKKVLPLELSLQDHKPLHNNDKGPNTGGMGAYGPAPVANNETVRSVARDIMAPLVQRLSEEGTPYKGFLYAGMIMTSTGPKVIEFNIRFGDPECQPAMMMLKDGGLYKPLSLALEGRLNQAKFEFKPGASCCVVLASKGYPADYGNIKGRDIKGIDEANQIPGVKVFHAGTSRSKEPDNADYIVSGGRVLGVTGYSPRGIADAQQLAYKGVNKIVSATQKGTFHFRTDIANKALTIK